MTNNLKKIKTETKVKTFVDQEPVSEKCKMKTIPSWKDVIKCPRKYFQFKNINVLAILNCNFKCQVYLTLNFFGIFIFLDIELNM